MQDLIILIILAFIAIKMLLVNIKVSAPFYSSQIILVGYLLWQCTQQVKYILHIRTELYGPQMRFKISQISWEQGLPVILISNSCLLEDDKGSGRMLHGAIFSSWWVLGEFLRFWGAMFIFIYLLESKTKKPILLFIFQACICKGISYL